jgi:hypothetical protein
MGTHKAFDRLNLTEIRPEGWLKRQLQIQMDGLSGRLHEIWDSVGSYSGWLGGTGENWERAPYYLDGLLPLAHYLNDEKRWALCLRFVEWTLKSQNADGNFGPQATQEDYWSRYVMLKVLIQYQEITGDERVVPFMVRYFEYVAQAVDGRPMENWSSARVPDLLYCVKWAYEKTGDGELIALARKIGKQSYDWIDFLSELPFPRPTRHYINWDQVQRMASEEYDRTFPYHGTHIVNIAMGLKHPAMEYFFGGGEENRAVTQRGLAELTRSHGVASGCINGDEHLAGNNPNQGAELCSVVEAMFSLQSMIEVFGECYLGDLMEKLAYNALPATITEDFMGHQYLQQANQVLVTDEPRPWFNNGSDANLFGLEPNFGCCAANMHQGWPKFVDALWYRQGEDALVSMVFAPSLVSTIIGGEDVSIRLETEYPFRENLIYRFEKASPKRMTLRVRIPGWCDSPEISAGDAAVTVQDGMACIDGIFHHGDEVRVRLPMNTRRTHWYHDSIAIERGPLVFGLDIGERWAPLREVSGVKDYCVYPETPWNYALSGDGAIEAEESEVSATPFAKAKPPVKLKTYGKRLESWSLEGGNAGDLPQSPVAPDALEEEVRLIPFGCTKLRISQFPYFCSKA